MASDPAERLWEHAWASGRPGTIVAATGDRHEQQMEAATADFIDALDDFNCVLNGPRPSSGLRDAGRRSDVLPVRVAYAVAEAVRMLRDASAADCAWRVEAAWLAVLAGDIDDVPQHVALEERARN